MSDNIQLARRYNIPLISENQGLGALNDRLSLIDDIVNSLSFRLDNRASKSSMIRYNVPLAPGTGIGSLVYYDTDTKCFAQALAGTMPLPGYEGESIETPQSRVEGIVIDYFSEGATTGNILTGGYWESSDVAITCLGPAALPGTYYLSGVNAGKAVMDPGSSVRQPVLMYYGEGKFSMALFYQAHDNHFHSSASLEEAWLSATQVQEALDDPVTIPEGAKWGYIVADDQACARLGQIDEGVTAVFENGILDTPETYAIVTSYGRFTRSSRDDAIGTYGWNSSVDNSMGVIMYSLDPVPALGDNVWDDPYHTGQTYPVTEVGSDYIIINTGDSENPVYVTLHAAPVYNTPSYAWKYGSALRYTMAEFPGSSDTADEAWSNPNWLGAAEAILSSLGRMFKISDNILWCLHSTCPGRGAVTLFNHYPFAYGSAVLRTIVSADPDMLEVSIDNGRCVLTPNPFADGGTSVSATALADIRDGKRLFTSIIPYIVAGPGTSMLTAPDGGVTISASSKLDIPIDAYGVMHNGTTITNDGLYQFITFPQNRDSRLVMTLPVTEASETTPLDIYPWVMNTGIGGALLVSVYYVPTPNTAGATELPTTGQELILDASLTVPSIYQEIAYTELSTGIKVTEPGMIVATLRTANRPTSDIKLFRLGFVAKMSSDAIQQQTTESSTQIQGISTTGTAGSSIPIYTAIRMDSNGLLHICAASDAASADTCIGISLEAAQVGGSIKYAISGIVALTAHANFQYGRSVYVGNNGNLVQAVETGAAYTQRIGIALSPDTVKLDISAAILAYSGN